MLSMMDHIVNSADREMTIHPIVKRQTPADSSLFHTVIIFSELSQ